jgi:hypothetical protein
MSMTPAASRILGFVSLAIGLAILVVAFQHPLAGLCEPPVGAGRIALALAQAASLLALLSLRRSGAGGAAIGVAGATWAVACAIVLLARACAGHRDALTGLDVAYAAGGALALACLAGGLSAKVSRPAGVALGVAACLLAGFGAAWLVDGLARDRAWITWARMQEVSSILTAAAADGATLPPGTDVEIAAVLGALPPEPGGPPVTDDAWGRPLLYSRSAGGWRVVSLGADAKPGPYSSGASRDFVDDLVLENGTPVAWPEQPCSGEERLPPASDAEPSLNPRIRRLP